MYYGLQSQLADVGHVPPNPQTIAGSVSGAIIFLAIVAGLVYWMRPSLPSSHTCCNRVRKGLGLPPLVIKPAPPKSPLGGGRARAGSSASDAWGKEEAGEEGGGTPSPPKPTASTGGGWSLRRVLGIRPAILTGRGGGRDIPDKGVTLVSNPLVGKGRVQVEVAGVEWED